MKECYNCGFYKWYACPVESEKLENQKELEEYARRHYNGNDRN